MPEWISVREAAQISNYNQDHLRVLVREGKISAKKVVTIWQIDKDSLIEYLTLMKSKGKKRGRKPNL